MWLDQAALLLLCPIEKGAFPLVAPVSGGADLPEGHLLRMQAAAMAAASASFWGPGDRARGMTARRRDSRADDDSTAGLRADNAANAACWWLMLWLCECGNNTFVSHCCSFKGLNVPNAASGAGETARRGFLSLQRKHQHGHEENKKLVVNEVLSSCTPCPGRLLTCCTAETAA